MQDDPFADRKQLTFAQAEGAAPLPSQLAVKNVSPQLRAQLWRVVHESMSTCRKFPETYTRARGSHLRQPWAGILYRAHVERDQRLADEFENSFEHLNAYLKQVFECGDYVAVFDLLQWLLRQPDCPIRAQQVQAALVVSGAAYRLLDDDRTIVPIASDAERQTLNRAFADVAASEFLGARTHLQNAAQHLSAGQSAASIRESIHAVESVARALTGADSLSGALKALEGTANLHPALKKGFGALYGFTSDEKGIRHPLIDEGAAKVDEADAQFMIGACAAFVSYLINRGSEKG